MSDPESKRKPKRPRKPTEPQPIGNNPPQGDEEGIAAKVDKHKIVRESFLDKYRALDTPVEIDWDAYNRDREDRFEDLYRTVGGTISTAEASNTRLTNLLAQPWATAFSPETQLRDEVKAIVTALVEQTEHIKATGEQTKTLVTITDQASQDALHARIDSQRDAANVTRLTNILVRLTVVLVFFTVFIAVLTGVLVAKELGWIEPTPSVEAAPQ